MHNTHLWNVLMKPSTLLRAALACLLGATTACDYFAPIESPDASAVDQRDAGEDGEVGAAVVLVAASGATVSEAGASVTLSFSLSQRPSSLVLITASSSDGDELELDPESLTFTPDQWQQDKTIVARGVDDLEADGDALVTVSFEPIVSDDPAYSGLELDPVDLVNEDGVCGNDVVDGDEVCDPPDPDVCAQASGSCTICNGSCQEEVVEGGPRCGDGVVNQDTEQCDAPGQVVLCPNGRAVVTCQDGCRLPSQGCEPRVDVGAHGGCYIEDDETVTCWGRDHMGVATPPNDVGGFVQVAVDGGSACGLRAGGQVTCWGAASGLPVDTLSELGLVHLDVSDAPAHLCGVDSDAIAHCVGANDAGQVTVPDVGFAQVEVGGQGSCGVTLDGELVCWGEGADLAPTADMSQRFTYVSGNGGNWCALSTQGKITCWGPDVEGDLFPQNGFIDLDFGARSVCGVLGLDAQEPGVACVDLDAPSWVPSSSTATLGELPSISVGKRSVCFIDDGALACTQSDVHVGHAGLDLVALEAHEGCVCAVTGAGRLRCAGAPSACPAPQLNMLEVSDVALKSGGGCVIEQGTDDVSCWQASPDATPAFLYPVSVVGTPEVVEVSGSYGCALDTQNKVTCWQNARAIPGPSDDFLALSIGTDYACGVLDASGSVDCWSFSGGFLPIVSSPRDARDIEVVGLGGCFRDATSRLGCFGNLDFTYTSPSTPGELLSTGKSLCFIENGADLPRCYRGSAQTPSRFDGVPVELFAHADSVSYAVPTGRALVWRTD